MSRAEQASAFCSALLGGPEGDDRLEGLFTTLWTSGDKRTRWRRADEPGAVASLVAELDENNGSQAVYICTTLTASEKSCAEYHEDGVIPHGEGNCKHRPKAVDCAGLLGLWVEIDIAGAGHESDFLPPTREHAQRIIDAMGIKPTLVVSSGGGLHCWWMLAEPWLTRDADDPEAERLKMAKLEHDWVLTAKHHAEVLGRWKVDSVHDLARLLRPAGTTNRKIKDNPRPVVIVSHDPDAVYNPDDFEAFMPEEEILAAYSGPRGVDGVRINLSDDEKALLKDVSLNSVWARVNSPEYRKANYLPEWLEELLELLRENEEVGSGERRKGKDQGKGKSLLVNTWEGDRPDLKGDQSSLDASLVRLLADTGAVDNEGIIEALMCRRLRLSPDVAKTDKVDPRKRVDYLVKTVARFRLTSKLEKEKKEAHEERRSRMDGVRLIVDPKPVPEPPEVETDENGFIIVEDEAYQAFDQHAIDLINHDQATDEEKRQAADDKVKSDHTGTDAPPHPAASAEDAEPRWFVEERPEFERESMDELTELLVVQSHLQHGVKIWGLEVRDDGEKQKGRLMLRMPTDFDWPIPDARPTRYRVGRPLFTDWWRRDVFDTHQGFKKVYERDIRLRAHDSAGKEWTEILRSIVSLWRRDSSGADIATYAQEWLFDYLMTNHGTGQPNEVGSTGRPWVRKTNDWNPRNPPVILIDRGEFLEHCRRQPGALLGREGKDILAFLQLIKRRPRSKAPGMSGRPTWYEIEPPQFNQEEWAAIIEGTRNSYEISENKRHLHAVNPDGGEGGVSIATGQREAQ